jgi:hypothetical protein
VPIFAFSAKARPWTGEFIAILLSWPIGAPKGLSPSRIVMAVVPLGLAIGVGRIIDHVHERGVGHLGGGYL